MRLIFRNSFEKERVIAHVKNREEALKEINNFLEGYNYKSYYYRVWSSEDGRTWFDVGSHSEFFILESEDDDYA